MRRRITLVVDDDMWFKARGARFAPRWPRSHGVTVESDVPIPDPDRVQEFRVRVVTKATDDPVTSAALSRVLMSCAAAYGHSVHAIDSTEVER